MFRIPRQQLEALDRIASADLHERIADFLRAEMAEETAELSDAELLALIRRAHAKAATHGIESDAGIAQYVCLSLEAGLDFGDQPEIAQFLAEPGADPEEQLDYLVDLLADSEELEELVPYAVDEGDEPMIAELETELNEREDGEI